LPDGRKHHHARVAAVVTSALTTIGLGLATASPAAAAPHDINAIQAQVDRLSKQADAAQKRHDTSLTTLTRARTQLGRLSTDIQRHRRIMDTLRAQVASKVVGN
jgi:septal ring factor EnvC (AmiA/AmiB activator)